VRGIGCLFRGAYEGVGICGIGVRVLQSMG
jgi:hypothetical protein